MDGIPNIGTTEDRKIHLEKPRVDSDECRARVDNARKKLYDEGYAVDGEIVDGFLKNESLVPTEVVIFTCSTASFASHSARLECIFIGSRQI